MGIFVVNILRHFNWRGLSSSERNKYSILSRLWFIFTRAKRDLYTQTHALLVPGSLLEPINWHLIPAHICMGSSARCRSGARAVPRAAVRSSQCAPCCTACAVHSGDPHGDPRLLPGPERAGDGRHGFHRQGPGGEAAALLPRGGARLPPDPRQERRDSPAAPRRPASLAGNARVTGKFVLSGCTARQCAARFGKLAVDILRKALLPARFSPDARSPR